MPDEAEVYAAPKRRGRVLRTLDDARRFIQEIGALLLERRDKLDDIAERKARLRAKMKRLDDEQEMLERRYGRRLDPRATAVFRYGQEHYDELTENGDSRTVLLSDGSRFRWRNSGLKVIELDDPKAFIREARRKRLFKLFVRVKTVLEPNLEALTAHPALAARLTTVRLGTEDAFTILPNGTDEGYRTIAEDESRDWTVEIPKERRPKRK